MDAGKCVLLMCLFFHLAAGKGAVTLSCGTRADYYKFRSKTIFDVFCPKACSARSTYHVWGNGIYTADSSICRAAIHDGHITDQGGIVTVYKQPGQPSYEGAVRNNVRTLKWPKSWVASFTFEQLEFSMSCSLKAEDTKFSSDFEFEVKCKSGCADKSRFKVWGSGIYTGDSSICRAAIHDGRITDAGGVVTVYKQPGQTSYGGSVKNSIETIVYGPWRTSFTFEKNDCLKRLDFPPGLNQAIHSNVSLVCPANCQNVAYRVWGTTLYTDDSNICAAAIHNGEIVGSLGGEVLVHILPGRSSYEGTTKNGITTENYGRWTRSFSFLALGVL